MGGSSERLVLVFGISQSSRQDETILRIQNFQKKQVYRKGSCCNTLEVDEDWFLWKCTEKNFVSGQMLKTACGNQGNSHEDL